MEEEECKLMAMSELSYVDRIRNIQKQKYPEKPDKLYYGQENASSHVLSVIARDNINLK